MTLMNVIRLHQHGGPEVLEFDQVGRPEPGPGQALVQVAAVGVNYADVAMRSGRYPSGDLPFIPGFEAAGTVVSVGSDADLSLVGRRVAALGSQAYAEYVVGDAATLIPLPDTLNWPQAAAFPAQGLAAYGMLHAAGLRGGETVLVHAAAGGVGSLALQIAGLLGAERVIGTAGTAEKRALAEKLGADLTIDYTDADWPDRLTELLGGASVDVALDLVGGPTTAATIPLLTPATGRVVLGGMSAGRPQLDPTPWSVRP